MSTLAARIAAAADPIIARALAAQYADPFWYARYGERADRRGREDGQFHLQYVAQALAAGDASVMTAYARWLQPLLTSRGMCTLHIAEHFERMAASITDELGVDAKPAVAMFEAATAALTYDPGPAAALQAQSPTIVQAHAAALAAAYPACAARCAHDLALLVSYAADALALGSPATFDAHVAWLAGFLADQGAPAGYLADLVARVRAAT